MGERREILGRLARICIAVEGGPGTAHEADVALQSGADVIPVARTGGCSADLYPRLGCPSPKVELEWSLLNDRMVNVERLGVAVRRIVEFLLQPNA